MVTLGVRRNAAAAGCPPYAPAALSTAQYNKVSANESGLEHVCGYFMAHRHIPYFYVCRRRTEATHSPTGQLG